MNKQEEKTELTEKTESAEAVQIPEAEEEEYAYRVKKSRKKEKIRARDVLLVVIPALAAVIAVVIALRFVNKATMQKVPEAGHQYYAGAEREVSGGTVLSRTDDGQTVLGEKKDQGTLSDLPVYYDNTEGIMLMKDMVYFEPRERVKKRVDHFSELVKDRYGVIHVKNGEADKALHDGFLFDAGSMYIFLEEVELNAEGFSVVLPPLSYVEGVYGNTVKTFNSSTKETEEIETSREVTAVAADGSYTILIFGDMVEREDGSHMLLYVPPKDVESIF